MDKTEQPPLFSETELQTETNIAHKLVTIHNALLDTTFIPEITEMNENKVRSIKYCLRK